MGNRIIFNVSIDIAPFRKAINEMTEITNTFFDAADSRASAFSKNLGSIGSNFNISERFDTASRSIFEGASVIDEYNNSLRDTYEMILDITTTLVGGLGPYGAIASATAGIAHREDWGGQIHRAIQSEIPFILQTMDQLFIEPFRMMREAWDALFGDLSDSAEVNLAPLADWINSNVTSPTKKDWERAFQSMGHSVNNFSEEVMEILDSFAAWTIVHVIDVANKNWEELFENLSQKASLFGKGLFEEFTSIPFWMAESVVDIVKGDWDKLWENMREGTGGTINAIVCLFERLPGGIRSPLNGIVGFVRGMAQRVVSGINTVIDGINSMSFDLPSWLGGGSFRPNIPKITAPQIPELARGGIVDRPTLALIGERGKEAVMPLENNTGWISDLANSIGSVVSAQLAINQAGFGNYSALDSGRPIQLYLDGRKVAEGIMDDFIEIARQRDIQLSPAFA